MKYEEHSSPKLKTYLAWTLGEIGKSQKDKYGGVSADIIITLLRLLKSKNKNIFEESVEALKKIEMPEFIHSLYLYNVGAVNILGLKPSQKGLYELSETIHFLIETKKRAIIAVNGDSGTGKTYFCQSLMNGFGGVHADEILYMMRDNKKDQKILNQILGIQWLKKHIDPTIYSDYSHSEEKDDPAEFFRQFLKKHTDKKLILLDGCRDLYYFQRIIDIFYINGQLDVAVNFRANPSTRRFNLEEREKALESIKTHLSFIEEPALEDTFLYSEGKAALYDLDNSISHRLGRQEIQELFQERRIENWGDLIRVGHFEKESHPLQQHSGRFPVQREKFSTKTYNMKKTQQASFSHDEKKFRMDLNKDLTNQPQLLSTIETNDLKPKSIQFYAQDQIAGLGEEGAVFVLTFLDNRIFYTSVGNSKRMILLGREIFSLDQTGELTAVSFERNLKTKLRNLDSPVSAFISFSTDKMITGHEDGSIQIWNFAERTIQVIKGHPHPVLTLAADHFGRIYSASSDQSINMWDTERGFGQSLKDLEKNISLIQSYPPKKILYLTGPSSKNKQGGTNFHNEMTIFDFETRSFLSFTLPVKGHILNSHVNSEGKIVASLSYPKHKKKQKNDTMAIISPERSSCKYTSISGHEHVTKDCFTMGPKIITCGTESSGNHTLRLWGTENYVQKELSKLRAYFYSNH
jgi:uridine kinase